MTIIFTEGFDHYTLASTSAAIRNRNLDLGKRFEPGTAIALTTVNYLSLVPSQGGGYALQSGINTSVLNSLNYIFPVPMTTLCFGVLHHTDQGTSCIIRFDNNSTSFIQFRLVSGLPTVVTPSETHSADVMYTTVEPWNYYEIKIEISGTTANVTCWMNGTLILTLPAITWYAAGNQQIERFTFGKISGFSTPGIQVYDNVYMTDGENIGPIEIKIIHPSADTATKEWIPSTGSDNFSLISEDVIVEGSATFSTPSMVTNIQATTSGQTDIYELESVGTLYEKYDILAITPLVFGDQPSGTDPVQTSLYDDSLNRYDLETFTPVTGTLATLKKYTPMETNPITLSSWTGSDIASLRIGIEFDPTP